MVKIYYTCKQAFQRKSSLHHQCYSGKLALIVGITFGVLLETRVTRALIWFYNGRPFSFKKITIDVLGYSQTEASPITYSITALISFIVHTIVECTNRETVDQGQTN